MKKFALFLLALCAALVPVGGLAVPGWGATTKYYVNKDSGNDNNNDGSSAVDAFKTITYALEKAQENDTIFVAATNTPYTEDTLTITKTITLESNGATLDGQEKRRVIKITGGNPTIKGFTITKGKVEAVQGGTDDPEGGGIWLEGNSTIEATIEDCTFRNNKAQTGGGLAVRNGKAIVNNCVFDLNDASLAGGGLYVVCTLENPDQDKKSSVTVTNCTFSNNTSELGGGVFVGDNTDVSITNCTFTGNEVGTMVGTDTNGGSGSNVTVNFCTFATKDDTIQLYGSNHLTVKNSIVFGGGTDNVTLTDHCLTKKDLNVNELKKSDNVEDVNKKVKHTVFMDAKQLDAAIDASDDSINTDQLGYSKKGKRDIGAVEIGTKSTPTPPTPAPETFTPDAMFFDKASVELVAEPGGTAEGSINVRLKLKGSNGTVKEDTSGYKLVCEKESVGVDWVTSSVDGWTVTFRAAPPANQTKSYTTLFTICVVDNKDGKGYLKTSYRVVTSISKLKEYQLTVAPAEVMVLAGTTDKEDLKNSVRFEKVFENSKRMTVNDAKLTFSQQAGGRATPWMDLNSGGEVTLAPGGDVEAGRYFCDYRAVADDNGQTATAEGTLIVNVVQEGSPKITTETLPDGEVGQTYSVQMTATGVKPYWTISGTPSEGLTFDMATAKLSGTPTRVGDYTLDVTAMNSAGSDRREFNLKVRNQKPSSWHWARSSKATMSGSTGTWHATFNVKKGTNVSYYDKSTTKDNLDKAHLKKVIKTKRVKAGEGYIKFDLLWPKTNNKWEEYTYAFKVQAKNNEGISTYEKSFTVAENTGKLSVAGVSLAADDAITEDDGVETFEPYKDGETPEDDGLADGVMYFANGSVDEDGNITAVIGTPVEGDDEGKKYVFATVAEMLDKLKDSQGKIVSIEFRKGTTVDADVLRSLPNLEDLAIDECESLEDLNLSECTKLTRLSLYGCGSLTALNVSGCSSLVSLSVLDCTKLETLTGVGDCTALVDLSLYGAAIDALDLSGRAGLTALNLNGCGELKTLKVTGCAALTDVSLNGTAITDLDLSACSGLKSLSLADVSELFELTLPAGAAFDDFTLTGSRVWALTLKGTEKLTTLDLSDNAGLISLELSGCPSLSELDVSGCGFEILDLSGCTSLEKLNANECAAMTTLTLPGSGAQDASVSASATAGKLKELSVGGCADLRSLNVSGQSLGHLELDGLKWLTRVQCDGQFIGGVEMSKSMSLKDYAGNCLYRVSDVQGYAADGAPVETSWNKDTGAVTFASVPADMSYAYDTGLYDNVLGVTVSSSNDPDNSHDSPTSNRGGGGCDAGLGFAGLLAITGLVATRKH